MLQESHERGGAHRRRISRVRSGVGRRNEPVLLKQLRIDAEVGVHVHDNLAVFRGVSFSHQTQVREHLEHVPTELHPLDRGRRVSWAAAGRGIGGEGSE